MARSTMRWRRRDKSSKATLWLTLHIGQVHDEVEKKRQVKQSYDKPIGHLPLVKQKDKYAEEDVDKGRDSSPPRAEFRKSLQVRYPPERLQASSDWNWKTLCREALQTWHQF